MLWHQVELTASWEFAKGRLSRYVRWWSRISSRYHTRSCAYFDRFCRAQVWKGYCPQVTFTWLATWTCGDFVYFVCLRWDCKGWTYITQKNQRNRLEYCTTAVWGMCLLPYQNQSQIGSSLGQVYFLVYVYTLPRRLLAPQKEWLWFNLIEGSLRTNNGMWSCCNLFRARHGHQTHQLSGVQEKRWNCQNQWLFQWNDLKLHLKRQRQHLTRHISSVYIFDRMILIGLDILQDTKLVHSFVRV